MELLVMSDNFSPYPLNIDAVEIFNICYLVFKGVLNPNFRPFSFELQKNRFFKINFYLGFRVL